MRTNARIYVMRAPDGALKLGHSVNPERRAKQLGNPDLVHQTDVIEQAERIERLAHRVLALHGKHLRDEWFEASLEDAMKAIDIATRQAENKELALGGKLKIGRPPKDEGAKYARINIRAPQWLMDAIRRIQEEEFARNRPKDAADVIRDLLAEALEQRGLRADGNL